MTNTNNAKLDIVNMKTLKWKKLIKSDYIERMKTEGRLSSRTINRTPNTETINYNTTWRTIYLFN